MGLWAVDVWPTQKIRRGAPYGNEFHKIATDGPIPVPNLNRNLILRPQIVKFIIASFRNLSHSGSDINDFEETFY